MRNISNKSGWIVRKFEDFVENVREQAIPTKEDSEKYIGLEHLDSRSLHVRRWGTKIQLKGTKFRMKKGDLLFARRNAYLRRVAIAPHDGLFSAHGIIFRPKADIVLSDFLPFFLLSDVFMDRAIKISVGSLSPTINWGTLRHEEFSLPPLNEQKRLADLLWSVDEVEEKYLNLKNSLLKTFWAFFYKSMPGYKKIKLGDVLIPKKKQSKYPHCYQKYLGLEHICSGSYVTTSLGSSENAKANTFIFEKGDLLYGKLRPYLDKCIIADFDGVCSTEILVYGIKDGFLRELIFFYMHSPSFINYVSNQGYGTKMPRVSHDIISEYIISMPPVKEQKKIYAKINEIQKNFEGLIININKCKLIQKQIINQIFGGKS